jgi:acetyltransferase-like isoleucine patch superfamily enzyme
MSDFYWKVWSVLILSRRLGQLGRRSWMRRPLLLVNPRHIRIGSGCLIRDRARIEALATPTHGQGYVTIGNNVTVEQDSHIVSSGIIEISDDVALGPRCSLFAASHPIIVEGNPARTLSDAAPSIHIGRGCLLGANVVVLPGVSIGSHSVIGANSVVTRSIPEQSTAAGNPARVLRRLDR